MRIRMRMRNSKAVVCSLVDLPLQGHFLSKTGAESKGSAEQLCLKSCRRQRKQAKKQPLPKRPLPRLVAQISGSWSKSFSEPIAERRSRADPRANKQMLPTAICTMPLPQAWATSPESRRPASASTSKPDLSRPGSLGCKTGMPITCMYSKGCIMRW